MKTIIPFLSASLLVVPAVICAAEIQQGEMAGYLFGPVAFFTPFFWSQATLEKPEWAGLMLDSRPVGPNKPIQMETQHVPAILNTSADGKVYARVAPTSFPVGSEGHSTVLHRITAYKKAALWDDVQRWFGGGAPADGLIRTEGAAVHKFGKGGGSSWSLYVPIATRQEWAGAASHPNDQEKARP